MAQDMNNRKKEKLHVNLWFDLLTMNKYHNWINQGRFRISIMRLCDNPIQCPGGSVYPPLALEKPQNICQMIASPSLMFEPPAAHSRATGSTLGSILPSTHPTHILSPQGRLSSEALQDRDVLKLASEPQGGPGCCKTSIGASPGP